MPKSRPCAGEQQGCVKYVQCEIAVGLRQFSAEGYWLGGVEEERRALPRKTLGTAERISRNLNLPQGRIGTVCLEVIQHTAVELCCGASVHVAIIQHKTAER